VETFGYVLNECYEYIKYIPKNTFKVVSPMFLFFNDLLKGLEII
jgi:hypothetical protein